MRHILRHREIYLRFALHYIFGLAWKRYRKFMFFHRNLQLQSHGKYFGWRDINFLTYVLGFVFYFDKVSNKKNRSEKTILFLELELICQTYKKRSFWSFCKRDVIVGNRQNDELWGAVKSVSEEIFRNPFQPRNYIHISFILANKIFLTDRTKNLQNRPRPERDKLEHHSMLF